MSINNKSCLLVIDMQNDSFVIPGGAIVAEQKLKSNIIRLTKHAREKHIPVLFTRYYSQEGSLFARDSAGFQLIDQLAITDEDSIIDKPDSDSFLKSSLQSVLQKLGINQLYICGLQTEYCIDSTCRTAYAKGYSVHLISDAHGSSDNSILSAEQIIEHHNMTLSRAYVSLVSSEEFLRSE